MGKDVAKGVGELKMDNTMAAQVCHKDKTSTLIQGSGTNYKPQAVIINECGLYGLNPGSKPATALGYSIDSMAFARPN